jgi:hypothetical protein
MVVKKGIKTMKELICYCLEYTRQDIKQDFLENGRSKIMEKIMAKKKLGRCHCATLNPAGR